MILTKRVDKMTGYWPWFFLCAFMDREEVKVHNYTRKTGKVVMQPSILKELSKLGQDRMMELSLSIKVFSLIWSMIISSSPTKRIIPSG